LFTRRAKVEFLQMARSSSLPPDTGFTGASAASVDALRAFGLERSALCSALISVALEAGRIQLRYHAANVPVMTKPDQSPVTCADQESEALILAALARLAPNIPVVAEEEASAGRIPSIGRAFFLVDPLDGTREFIAGRLEFTINVALIADHVPVFGLVYAPATGDFFITPAPNRAAVAKLRAGETYTHLEPDAFATMHVRTPRPDALVAVASRSHMNAETEALLAKYPIVSRQSAGSSLKFCLVAKGDADIYPRIGPTNEWDTAAGHAILAAAGGTVTMLNGAPLRYGKADVRYANPDFIAWGGPPLSPKTAD
jgi:3'(2'), 5'-bisphosphate nucleotidase